MAVRHVVNINNCSQLLTDGEKIYLSSKGRNEFLPNREMLLGYQHWFRLTTTILSKVTLVMLLSFMDHCKP